MIHDSPDENSIGARGSGDESATDASAPKEPGPYGRIAKKMASRTTDLIAIGLLAVAALTVGRQISVWWNTDPAESQQSLEGLAVAGPNWTDDAVVFELGDLPYEVRRESFAGTFPQASEKLVELCLADVRSTDAPQHPRTPGERKMLAHLRDLPPAVEEEAGQVVHFVPIPVPMAVGIRDFPIRTVPSGSVVADNEDTEVSNSGRRIVSWGLAMRRDEQAWTLFIFRAGLRNSEREANIRISLPPECRKTLALRGSSGARFVGFEGSGPANEWTEFFDTRGWRPLGNWRVAAGTWTMQYEVQATENFEARRVDVQFGEDERVGFSGLIAVAPIAERKGNR